MCTRPQTSDSARQSSPPLNSAPSDTRRPYVSRPSMVVDFANPGVCVCVCVELVKGVVVYKFLSRYRSFNISQEE